MLGVPQVAELRGARRDHCIGGDRLVGGRLQERGDLPDERRRVPE